MARKRPQKSDEAIVASKRGNARGAKGLYVQKETFQSNGGKPLDCEVLYGRGNPRDCRKAASRRLSAPCAHEGETVGKGEERTEVSVLQPQEARRGDGDAQVRVGASPREQRRYRLKYAETYYGELQKLGLVALTRRRYR